LLTVLAARANNPTQRSPATLPNDRRGLSSAFVFLAGFGGHIPFVEAIVDLQFFDGIGDEYVERISVVIGLVQARGSPRSF